jgi:hypothetical protein
MQMQLDSPVLIGVYVASITAITSVITNLITIFISNYSQNRRENKNWLRGELRDIYSGCIQNLSTLLTLSGIDSNLDSIEQSIVESKKYLALSLIYNKGKQIELLNIFEEEALLFILGKYEQLLDKAKMRGIEPSPKYRDVKAVYGSADIMLGHIVEIASQDQRLG